MKPNYVNHVLHHQSVPMFGNECLPHAIRIVLSRAVKVPFWNRAVRQRLRREERIREAMLVDEILRRDPKNLGPNFTNSVLEKSVTKPF